MHRAKIIDSFRVISLLEGVSFVLLLSVVYLFNSREFVYELGMGHGLLYLVYFAASLWVSHKLGWSILFWLLLLLCAVVPLAFIPLELWLRSVRNKSAESNPSSGNASLDQASS